MIDSHLFQSRGDAGLNMSSNRQQRGLIRFGVFEADVESRTLRKAGARIRLQEKPFRVLEMLLGRPGEVVAREAFHEQLWPGEEFGEFDLGLNQAVKKLRQALNDSADSPRWIETIPKIGYKFLAPVVVTDPGLADLRPSRPSSAELLLWSGLAACAVLAFLAGFGLIGRSGARAVSDAPNPGPVRKFTLDLEHAVGEVALSPNGRYLAYTRVLSAVHGIGSLWLRDLQTGETRSLVEEPVVHHAFWSPDSNLLGFAVTEPGGRYSIGKIEARGGTRVKLCERPMGLGFTGGAWHPNSESIVVTTRPAALYELPSRGGVLKLLFRPEQADKDVGYFHPSWLSLEQGGPAVVFSRGKSLQDLELLLYRPDSGSEPAKLGAGFAPAFSPTGHLLHFGNANDVWALPFSIASMSSAGRAFLVAEAPEIQAPTVARDGTLAYIRVRETGQMQLLWRDRTGREIETAGAPQTYIGQPSLAADGIRVAVSGGKGFGEDVYIHDLRRPRLERLTFSEGRDSNSVWSPDGKEIVFASFRDGSADLFIMMADGSTEATKFFGTEREEIPADWSSDDRYILFNVTNPGSKKDLSYIERQENGSWSEPRDFLKTDAVERVATFSPNNRFVAYVSDESGRDEIYVRPFPPGEGVWQISRHGGGQPRWSPDGSELFYVENETLFAVPVKTDRVFSAAESKALFTSPNLESLYPVQSYDVAPDGRRFVMVARTETPKHTIQIVQNWYEEFRGHETD